MVLPNKNAATGKTVATHPVHCVRITTDTQITLAGCNIRTPDKKIILENLIIESSRK